MTELVSIHKRGCTSLPKYRQKWIRETNWDRGSRSMTATLNALKSEDKTTSTDVQTLNKTRFTDDLLVGDYKEILI